MTQKLWQARQGDVVLQAVETLPVGAKKTSDGIVARGEKSGHTHEIHGAQVYEVMETTNTGARALVKYAVTGEQPASLVHQEHKAIVLPARTVIRFPMQRVFDGMANVQAQD